MWSKELTNDDKKKIEEVLKEARRENIPIFDRRVIKKNGKLYLLWSYSEIHEVEVGTYA